MSREDEIVNEAVMLLSGYVPYKIHRHTSRFSLDVVVYIDPEHLGASYNEIFQEIKSHIITYGDYEALVEQRSLNYQGGLIDRAIFEYGVKLVNIINLSDIPYGEKIVINLQFLGII